MPTRMRVWHRLELYRTRDLIEACSHKLERVRVIATRYDKTACRCLGLAHIACIFA